MTLVGIVVPAHRDTGALTLLLDSIGRLEHPADQLRVVVAVDGADPATVAAATRPGVDVVVLPINGGSYTARNAALDAMLREPVEAVLFTDSDCVVHPEWVDRHLAALADADLSGGDVRFTFRRRRPSPAEWVDSCRHLKQETYVARDGYAATCNLAVRRELLDSTRFDGSLRTGGDAELCRRLVAQGHSLVFTADALVDHPARTLRELVVKVQRLIGGIPRQADRWVGRPVPPRRLTRGIWRRAREAGHDVGPVWGVTACLLNWVLDARIRRAVLRLRAAS